MRSHLLVVGPFLLLCAAAPTAMAIAGCSGAGAARAADPDPNPGTTDPDGGADGPTGPASGPATWSEAPVDPLFRVGQVAGDARGIWVSLYVRQPNGGQWTAKVASIGADGTLTERYANTVSTTLSPNYGIAGLTPLTSSTAAIGGEWFFAVIGGAAPLSLGSTSSYITAIHGRADNDIWAGTRVGTLTHATGAATSATFRLADELTVRGLWQSNGALYLATVMGVRSAALPIASGWNGATTRAMAGSFQAIAGSADDDAFAVGEKGLIAHFDGASWKAQASGTTAGLGAVATRRKDDAWASSSDAILHFDGAEWWTVSEPGMAKGAGSVAIAADGTLWVARDGKLLRRSPGPVKGTPTKAVDAPDGGACAFGEPNDSPGDATELAPPFAINACAPSKDRDDYTFVTPAGKAGFASITLTDTAGEHPAVTADVDLQNQTTIVYTTGPAGSSRSLFLPMPGARRRHVAVLQSRDGVATAGAYALAVKYTTFDDAYEPNDTYFTAAEITSGTAIASYFPTGMTIPSSFGQPYVSDNQDWYQATRPAGAFSVSLTNVAADCRGRLSVEGIASGSGTSTTLGTVSGALGEAVTFTGTLAVAGKVRVTVTDFAPRILDGTNPPGAFTQKYALLIGD